MPNSVIAIDNDAGNIAEIPNLFQAIASIGKLDGMVLNAGFVQAGKLLEVYPEQFDNTMNINVKSVFFPFRRLSSETCLRQTQLSLL